MAADATGSAASDRRLAEGLTTADQFADLLCAAVGLLDRWFWKCSVCGASTSRRHHHCRVCTAIRDDMLPFPSPRDLDETAG
jgi:hypothetical protein